MLDFIIENRNILFIMIIAWGLLSIIIVPLLRRLRVWLETHKWFKTRYMKNFLITIRFLLLLTTIVLLTELQERYELVSIGDKTESLGLVITILTIYGILYTFIQFAIGYANQKKNDKYWGESTIGVLLKQDIVFAFFHSRLFKFLLLFSALLPLVNWESLSLVKDYQNLIRSFWTVCLTTVYVLYVFLFTRSLFIMRRLFSLQKSPDYSTIFLIKKEKETAYRELFNYSFKKKNDLFITALLKESMSLDDEAERKNMFKHILTDTLYSFTTVQKERSKRNKKKKRRKRSKDTKPKLYKLYRDFSLLYTHEDLKEIGLTFEELLNIYRLTENVLFNEVKWLSKGDENKFVEELVELYSNGYSFHRECTYYTVPQIIWDQVRSCEDLSELHRQTKWKDARIKIQHAQQVSPAALNDDLELLNKSEEDYLWRLLDKSKEFLEELKNWKNNFVFKTEDEYVKDIIYHYIISLEFTEINKSYIEILIDVLDYKYKVALVFYFILHPSDDEFIKKQQDVLFLQRLLVRGNTSQRLSDPAVKEFVLLTIDKSSVHYKIGPKLIEWIFDNLKISSTDVNLIQSCISEPYFSYAKLLKFKFIFFRNYADYPDFSALENTVIKQEQFDIDWRIGFLKEMLSTPDLLEISFFNKYILRLSEQISKTSEAIDLYRENDFRLFYINPWFRLKEIQLWRLHEDRGYLNDSIWEFLILKLGETAYDYLFTNNRIRKTFKERVTKIINQANLDIEHYVDLLAERANEITLSDPVTVLKKEIIVRKLYTLIYESLTPRIAPEFKL